MTPLSNAERKRKYRAKLSDKEKDEIKEKDKLRKKREKSQHSAGRRAKRSKSCERVQIKTTI